MPRNAEIKARVESVEVVRPIAVRIADQGPIEIAQEDTFFNCRSGRLKLRMFSADSGELIYYQRAQEAGPKESFYLRSQTSTPAILRDSLTLAYGQAGRVKKHRTLFLAGRTRIHLDVVEQLGHFVELEVVLDSEETLEKGISEARDLMEQLGIQESALIGGAYVDLLHRTPDNQLA